MKLDYFKTADFHAALRTFFEDLNIPVNYIAEEPARPQEILSGTYKPDHPAFRLMNDVYFLGMVDDAAFAGNASLAPEKIQSDYDGILIFGVTLHPRENGLLPTRSQLAEITRAFNREYHYTPVVVVFKYDNHIAFANAERLKYKQEWREGEKSGKVSLLRDIDPVHLHPGHRQILSELAISRSGTKAVNSFADLYHYWQTVFNVELLNKKFYRELSNWYFWAMQHVHFPFDDAEADKASLFSSDEKIREHDAKNLIRLLTRLLFVWFIKEKKLIPEAIFDSDKLSQDLLNHFDPDSRDTFFYKAILQNLFFATLNQTCGKRQFRNPGRQHRNITTLMRYRQLFEKPDAFIELVESVVPFMNGGLFDCLDKPDPTRSGPQGGEVIIYEDGFSDRGDNTLKVPDFLFFGQEESIDLSGVYGDKKRRQEKVRGIIPILNNYKFTIVENTPIEQEVALDPELLGKVFENLLASYNPETKTTARKQTGSFYTPRTIVDYMVDESLKAYLNRELCEACPEVTEDDAKEGLDVLFAYTEKDHAFTDAEKHALIVAIDKCKILDPACGSGAFPMGILHKLEFILGKLDPHNRLWRDRQIGKVDDTISVAEQIDDTTIREHTVRDLEAQKQDIVEAFTNNDLGYGRKLYLIENCIYGVDIQSIATQVSKLRFFISLIVEQGSNPEKENFGIRPLPNLETKFTTANTLIGIEKPAAQGELFESKTVKALEKELKQIRHNLFNAKTPKTKRKYRLRDKELREQIAEKLEANGWGSDSARQLSQWDPYDQNASSPFFDIEWMYGITDGFDIVIGNPPYISIEKFAETDIQKQWKNTFSTFEPRGDIYCLFYERGIDFLTAGGSLIYITSNKWMRARYGKKLRNLLTSMVDTKSVLDFGMAQNFGAATTYTSILLLKKHDPVHTVRCCYVSDDKAAMADPQTYFISNSVVMEKLCEGEWVVLSANRQRIKSFVENEGIALKKWDLTISSGIKTSRNEAFIVNQEKYDELLAEDPSSKDMLFPILRGQDVKKYGHNWQRYYVIGTFKQHRTHYNINDYPAIKKHLLAFKAELEPRPSTWNTKRDGKWSGRNTQPFDYLWYEVFFSPNMEEFYKPKLMYPNMTKFIPFFFDSSEHLLCNQKAFIITSEHEPLEYLATILNSSLFRCCFRDNFPELLGNTYELSKIYFKEIPIKKPNASIATLFKILVDYVQFAKAGANQSISNGTPPAVIAAFLEELIDACVMEIYFADHMAEKNLTVIAEVNQAIQPFSKTAPDSAKWQQVQSFHETVNAPNHPIRNRLMRIPIDSPDLLRVIQEEGRV